VCCSVLQSVAECCSVLWSVLQHVAVCCDVLRCVAMCCNVLQCVAMCCSVYILLQCVAVCCGVCFSVSHLAADLSTTLQPNTSLCEVCHSVCSVLRCVTVCCSVLQCIAVYCRVLQCAVECVAMCHASLLISPTLSSPTHVCVLQCVAV